MEIKRARPRYPDIQHIDTKDISRIAKAVAEEAAMEQSEKCTDHRKTTEKHDTILLDPTTGVVVNLNTISVKQEAQMDTLKEIKSLLLWVAGLGITTLIAILGFFLAPYFNHQSSQDQTWGQIDPAEHGDNVEMQTFVSSEPPPKK